MEQDPAAARAIAKSRKRPLSRASTTSIHSATPQPSIEQKPAIDQIPFAETSGLYAGQWIPNDHHAHPKDISAAPHLSPEDMILQAATHMQSANHDFQMDGSMNAALEHHMAYQQHHALSRHPLPAEQHFGGPNATFADRDSQMPERDDNEDGDSMNGASGAARIISRSSANNELEMRHLFHTNRHRTLQDVARELHGNERGPNSERTRQVFAMLWINSVCSKGKGSVPRGRVYANYASRCATERITVLNPASFGKLVRVLFPGLKTRRLGVRGESKYHYVNFSLIEDQPDIKESQSLSPGPLQETRNLIPSFKWVLRRLARGQEETQEELTETFITYSTPAQSGNAMQAESILPRTANQDTVDTGTTTKSLSSSRSIYNNPDLGSLDSVSSTSNKTRLDLAFLSPEQNKFEQSEPILLPPIQSFLPRGTDPDAAKSLSALYRSHCTSLVECIRYCREKTFFHLYTSFQGTLTMPVQKLFGNPALAPWIEGCDIALYQRMIRIVSGLTLQVVPKPVLDTLRNIAEKLVPHIRDSFQGQPQHVIAAKEAPAVIFARLLDRALRVNLTAHAAANMLSNPANRDQMYLDWITMIRARRVAECVPTRGMDDVVNLLVTEMRDLLDPASVPWEVECLTIYGDVTTTKTGRQTETEGGGGNTAKQNTLDRWVNFLQSLPSRFPYASHGDIVWCVERIGTAVMRDLTLAQGKSFGSWWVTKTWVDEMTCFLAEQGGFMKRTAGQFVGERGSPPQGAAKTAAAATPMTTTTTTMTTTTMNTTIPVTAAAAAVAATPRTEAVTTRQPPPAPTTRQSHGRYSAGSEDLGVANIPHTQAGRAPFPPTNGHAQQHTMVTDPHDDSGIAMRTPEDDFPIDKFTFSGPDAQAMLSETELAAGSSL